MKKKTLALGVALSVLTLAGCSGAYEEGNTVEDGAWRVVGEKGRYDILRDTDTGCMYLQSKRSINGITPYYDEDGEIMGCGEEEVLKY